MKPKLITTPDELVRHLIYGDIDEMPLGVLGLEPMYATKLDDEQTTRLACAATVKAYFDGTLTVGGYPANTPKQKAKR